MRKAALEPDRVSDAVELVPWPLTTITHRLLARPTPPDLLLFYAEALEEAADHAAVKGLGINPCVLGLRNLAATVRAAVPARDDTNPETETTS